MTPKRDSTTALDRLRFELAHGCGISSHATTGIFTLNDVAELLDDLERTREEREVLAKRRSELRRLQIDLLLLAEINDTPGDWGELTRQALDILRQRLGVPR